MPNSKPPLQVTDYTVLPLHLPVTSSFPVPAIHYLYLRQHEPKIPHPDSPRSLFLVNVPFDATHLHLRSLFADQLGGGRVERVDFEDAPRTGKNKSLPDTLQLTGVKSRKRKRVDADAEDVAAALPGTWDRELHSSGSTAVVVFADRPSMELALKAVKKAARSGSKIVWNQGLQERLPALGSERYLSHHHLTFPAIETIQSAVDAYMTSFAAKEEAQAKALARQRQVPDSDGFITVTRGGRVGPARLQEAQEKLEELHQKEQAKRDSMGDFYRFQSRERKKAEAGQLMKRFQEDAKKVEQMRQQRKNRFKPA